MSEQFVRNVIGLDVRELPVHYLPSPHAYLEASLRGLGWGMNPAASSDGHLARKRLVDLFPGQWLEVPLFWQQWTLASPTLDALAAAIRSQTATSLQPLLA
jgi:LysR family transcriptional regulator (chromosome initiation inhibitor)